MKETKITVIIGSTNPAKVNAATNAFYAVFPDGVHDLIPFDANSNVSVQPKNEYETKTGALNRLNAAKDAYPDADYFISMEAGVINLPGSMVEIGYIAVSQKGYERIFFTEISRFEVPTEIARLIREGMEKGPAVDQVFNKTDSKKAGGLIGEVTDQVVTRTRLICLAAEIAFSQLKNKHLYPDRR